MITVHRNGLVSINGQATGWSIESWEQSDGKWFMPVLDGEPIRRAFPSRHQAIDYIVADFIASTA